MSVLGIDIAWDRPTVAAIQATGAHWVGRYFSADTTKNLTAAEVTAYAGAGLGTVTVWETTTGRATEGQAAGVADATAAEQQRRAVGLGDDHVHHFAVDEDTDWPSVASYFDGVLSVLGQARVGVYGGYSVIEGAHARGIRYLWQTTAWSAGQWSQYATIQQTGGSALDGNADLDYAQTADYGQSPRPTTPQGDDPMTPADVELFLNTKMPAWAALKTPGKPDYIPDVAEVLHGSMQADTKIDAVAVQVTAVSAQLGALASAFTAFSKAVTAAGGITAEQVAAAAQAGAAAELTELGHTLDGTPTPPAAH